MVCRKTQKEETDILPERFLLRSLFTFHSTADFAASACFTIISVITGAASHGIQFVIVQLHAAVKFIILVLECSPLLF